MRMYQIPLPFFSVDYLNMASEVFRDCLYFCDRNSFDVHYESVKYSRVGREYARLSSISYWFDCAAFEVFRAAGFLRCR